MNERALIWVIIAITGIVDGVLLFADGISVTSYWPPLAFTFFVCVLSLMLRRISSVSLLLMSVAQICAFSFVGALLTYAAMAASPFPMADALLSRADNALGFDWLAWFQWIKDHPGIHFLLKYAYASAVLQICGLIFYFSYADPRRVHEFLLAGMLSTIIIVPIMVLLPAVGAWSQHNVGVVEPWRDDILGLRSHTLMTIGRTNGIVSFLVPIVPYCVGSTVREYGTWPQMVPAGAFPESAADRVGADRRRTLWRGRSEWIRGGVYRTRRNAIYACALLQQYCRRGE